MVLKSAGGGPPRVVVNDDEAFAFDETQSFTLELYVKRDEVVGPAGPTTATRMDKFTRTMLEQTGLLGMIGKAERGPTAIEAIRDHESVYLMAVGGAAYLVAQAIKAARVVAFPELGMEAVYEFELEDMPVTVAVDHTGESVHQIGPKIWAEKINQRIVNFDA